MKFIVYGQMTTKYGKYINIKPLPVISKLDTIFTFPIKRKWCWIQYHRKRHIYGIVNKTAGWATAAVAGRH